MKKLLYVKQIAVVISTLFILCNTSNAIDYYWEIDSLDNPAAGYLMIDNPDPSVFNSSYILADNYGLAPYSSMVKYKNNPNVIVSTYNILQGTQQSLPKMCFGKYIDCYGKPCYPNYSNQKLANCQSQVKNGPYLTASANCGPNQSGYLPNGAAIQKQQQGIATANSVIKIINSARNK